MAEQVHELSALLNEVGLRQPGDPVVEPRNAEELAQYEPRIVETQGLIKVARNKIPLWASTWAH